MANELQPTREALGTAPPSPASCKTWTDRLRKIKVIEWLVMAAIVGVLVALLLPAVQSVGDGEISAPIEVTVFDAESLEPVEGARVAIVQALPGIGEFPVADFSGMLSPSVLTNSDFTAVAGRDGIARITCRFHTVTSHRNPQTRAYVNGHWILVAKEGFGTVAIPLRTESIPAKQIREQGKISAMVPLYRLPDRGN